MKQVSLLPSGCQGWSKHVLAHSSTGDRVAYCATLAAYVHHTHSGRLDKLVAAHERTLTSITWNPFDADEIATCAIDRRVCRWSLSRAEEAPVSCTFIDTPIMMEWCPSDPSCIAVLVKPGHVALWQYSRSKGEEAKEEEKGEPQGSKSKVMGKVTVLKGLDSGHGTCLRWSHLPSSAALSSAASSSSSALSPRPSTSASSADISLINSQMGVDVLSGDCDASLKLAVGQDDGSVLVWYAKDRRPKKMTMEGVEGSVVDVQWDPLSNDYLLVCLTKGNCVLIDVERQEVMMEFASQTREIQSSCFLPNRPGLFVTVNQRTPTLTLFNVSQREPMEVVRLPGKSCGILSIKALPISSSAASSSSASPSSSSPSSSLSSDFASLTLTTPPPPSSKLLIAFMDGSVGVFDFDTRAFVFCTEAGHSETIFDCHFKPDAMRPYPASAYITTPTAPPASSLPSTSSAASAASSSSSSSSASSSSSGDERSAHVAGTVLATASYDGSIKIWDTLQQRCLMDLRTPTPPLHVLYGLSWAPGDIDENRVLACSSEGHIFIWDAHKGQLVSELHHHSKASFRVAWNKQDVNLIASSSSDGYAVVFKPSGQIVHKYGHPAAVYGVDWSPFDKHLLCTGCHDGAVRVFDVSSASAKPRHTLLGHSARVFNTVWSPLLPHTLASGSDDHTVRVFDIQTGESIELKGHTSNVRALVWSYEVPYLLLSGSWDGTIRIWDIRKKKCLHVIADHQSDIYGLCSHPRRPMAFVSSSRDTSLRCFSMEDSVFGKVKMSAVLEGGLLPNTLLGTVEDAMHAEAPLRLCGAASQHLALALKACANDLQRYRMLFDFFSGSLAVQNLWKMVDQIMNQTPSSVDASQPHVTNVRRVALLRADELVRGVSVTGVADAQKGTARQRLQAAADLYLQAGCMRQYCDIMCQLGNWDRAIALAPCVSASYWKRLLASYGQHLLTQHDARAALPYLVGAGQVDQVLGHAVYRGDASAALLTAVSDVVGALPRLPDFGEDVGGELDLAAEHKRSSQVFISSRVSDVLNLQSASYLSEAQPLAAAASLLSLGDPHRAVQVLLQGDEVHVALALVRVLRLQFSDHVFRAASVRCEMEGLYDEGFQLTQQLKDARTESLLYAARHVSSNRVQQSATEVYRRWGLRSPEAFVESAEAAIKDGNRVEGVLCLVVGGAHQRAVDTGLAYLKELLSHPEWSVVDAQKLLAPLHSTPSNQLTPSSLQELMAYSFYIGAQVAISKTYSNLVTFLFAQLRSILQRNPSIAFPVPSILVKLQEASYLVHINPSQAQQLVQSVMDEGLGPLQAKLKTMLASINAQLTSPMPPQRDDRNLIVPSGAHLPSGSYRRFPNPSLISKTQVKGVRVVLEDGQSAIGRGEAMMMLICTPYSPLCTGAKLLPLCGHVNNAEQR